ncbi:MAG: prephenate dehydrogenase/arogenate dehydrogenase family protein [Gammaproteobacteria bacterium]|nr:prephenate dehydrogenase/arogenate dehydrogenase family protein [Gammaproteobacteria bacterium]MDH5801249.1 prephenate dehydrogenase/arogenate dehydrogenase family protein [Gammaproteobacteria bacterium]
MPKQITIIGVGLIGGSFALGLKKQGCPTRIVGTGRDAGSLEKALHLGVIDAAELDLQKAIKDADVVVLAMPVGATEQVLRQIQPFIRPGCIITDVGSSKGVVVQAAHAVFGEVPPCLVPGHPIAGTEKSGVEAAFAELFENRRVILTPAQNADPKAVETVSQLWQCTGAKVSITSVEHHDEVLAATSHLPHMLAFALVDTLATMDDKAEIFQFAAGGFRDFTRIASSDAQMWHDICVTNGDAILAMLDRFTADLGLLRQAIEDKNSDYILEVFRRAKKARDQFCGQ